MYLLINRASPQMRKGAIGRRTGETASWVGIVREVLGLVGDCIAVVILCARGACDSIEFYGQA